MPFDRVMSTEFLHTSKHKYAFETFQMLLFARYSHVDALLSFGYGLFSSHRIHSHKPKRKFWAISFTLLFKYFSHQWTFFEGKMILRIWSCLQCGLKNFTLSICWQMAKKFTLIVEPLRNDCNEMKGSDKKWREWFNLALLSIIQSNTFWMRLHRNTLRCRCDADGSGGGGGTVAAMAWLVSVVK